MSRNDKTAADRLLRRLALAGAAITVCSAGFALADVRSMFEQLDRNGDGWLSMEELEEEAKLRQFFAQADLDGNALLSPLEFRQLLSLPGAAPAPM